MYFWSLAWRILSITLLACEISAVVWYFEHSWASLVAQSVKNLPAVQETWVQSLGWEDPLEKEMATHSSILAWKISWTEEPGGLQSMGSQRVGHDWATNTSILWHCLSLGLEWNWLFPVFDHCWVFQVYWHIECFSFTASSFRIWNSSTGIPSPPLALFIVMLPKAHLILNSRMSGCRWVITLLWWSGSCFFRQM